MKLRIKQRMFTLLDNYSIFDETGNVKYQVEGQLALGHCLKIYDSYGTEIGTVRQKLLTLLPKFELYLGDRYFGCIEKEFSFFTPRYNIDCQGWHVEGDFLEWDYRIVDSTGGHVATISKEILNWTDTYSIDVPNPNNTLCALMLVLAIDAEKCSRN
jgi:uncharacterized protein YxjI